MSNLIKNVYFTVDESDKRVIDSDIHGKDVHPEIYEQQQDAEIKPFNFRQLSLNEETDDENVNSQIDDFNEGMNIISVDEVREEEKQKLSEELEEEKNRILSEAKEQAQLIVDEANNSAEEIKNQAFEEGKNQGLEEGRNQAFMQLEEQKNELEQEYEAKFKEVDQMAERLEPQYAELVVNLVEKLTGVVCADKKDVIIYLIDNALRTNVVNGIEKTKNITLHISKEDMGIVSAKRDELQQQVGSDKELDIIEDASLVHNQCIIDLDSKIIDCSLDAQLDNLKEQLRMLAM